MRGIQNKTEQKTNKNKVIVVRNSIETLDLVFLYLDTSWQYDQ